MNLTSLGAEVSTSARPVRRLRPVTRGGLREAWDGGGFVLRGCCQPLPSKSPRSTNCPALARCPQLAVSGNTAGAPLGTRAISRSCSSLRQGHKPSVWPGPFLGLALWPPRAWSRARSGCGHEEQEMEPTRAPACVPCIRICSSR